MLHNIYPSHLEVLCLNIIRVDRLLIPVCLAGSQKPLPKPLSTPENDPLNVNSLIRQARKVLKRLKEDRKVAKDKKA